MNVNIDIYRSVPGGAPVLLRPPRRALRITGQLVSMNGIFNCSGQPEALAAEGVPI